MGEIYNLVNTFSLAYKAEIRNQDLENVLITKSLFLLGEEVGKLIVERIGIKKAVITTPMGVDCNVMIPSDEKILVFSTKDDYKYFGKGICNVIKNSIQGYMDFSGKRGLSALSAQIRDIELPILEGTSISTIIIAKSILATGCTAISLTKRALTEYQPKYLICASIFYSNAGIADLQKEFNYSIIFTIGDPDELREDGMLIPGVGNLDERIRNVEER